MSNAAYHVRRATVDDLENLAVLWHSMRLPADQLESCLTEFQIVETIDGALLGAIGMQIVNRHARLHSEAFNDFAIADILRGLLWERLQSIATNHGLARIWTAETAPFWKFHGFHPAVAAEIKRLPPAWNSFACDWLTLELRDEDALRTSLERDFNRLRDEGRENNRSVLGNAKMLKNIAVIFGLIVAGAIIVFCISLLHYLPILRRH